VVVVPCPAVFHNPPCSGSNIRELHLLSTQPDGKPLTFVLLCRSPSISSHYKNVMLSVFFVVHGILATSVHVGEAEQHNSGLLFFWRSKTWLTVIYSIVFRTSKVSTIESPLSSHTFCHFLSWCTAGLWAPASLVPWVSF
jgi:hypothetical protein